MDNNTSTVVPQCGEICAPNETPTSMETTFHRPMRQSVVAVRGGRRHRCASLRQPLRRRDASSGGSGGGGGGETLTLPKHPLVGTFRHAPRRTKGLLDLFENPQGVDALGVPVVRKPNALKFGHQRSMDEAHRLAMCSGMLQLGAWLLESQQPAPKVNNVSP